MDRAQQGTPGETVTVERALPLDLDGRQCVFRVDDDPPLSFWRIESEGRVFRSPIAVSGNEVLGFFRALARMAVENRYL